MLKSIMALKKGGDDSKGDEEMAKQRSKIRIVRAEKKGWRPASSPLPEGIRKDVDRMAERVEKIIKNSHVPTTQDFSLLRYIQALCRRTRAFKESGSNINQLNELNEELRKAEDALQKFEFREKRDIIPLNLWITRRLVNTEGALENLLEEVGKKIGRAK